MFENFEDKNVKKKESFNEIGYNNKSIGKFGNSSPRKKVAEDDEYADDFDNEDIKKNKSKSKSKNKDKNKKHQNLPRNKTTKNMSKNSVDQSRAKGIP